MAFWDHVDKTKSCWVWTGFIRKDGYGWCLFKKKTQFAHRVSYQLIKGEIPKGFQIDHLCRNRACINPEHLQPVTQKVNALRGFGIGAKYLNRTHCLHGHEFTKENILIRTDGGRRCKACMKLRFALRVKPFPQRYELALKKTREFKLKSKAYHN